MNETRINQRSLIRISAALTDGATSGEDPRDFLQGLLTQDMAMVQPERPQWSALLSAQGKILYEFLLWADGDDILIDCEQAAAEALVKRLKLFRLRRKLVIEIDPQVAVHWALAMAGKPADPRLPALGFRWLETGSAEDARPGADDTFRAHRLSLGVAEGMAELGHDKILWLEANAIELHGVSFTKGCYVGQENTARMNYRQKVNRRIVVVPIEQSNEKRQIIAYPDLGLSIEHRRIDDLAEIVLPVWLEQALASRASDATTQSQ